MKEGGLSLVEGVIATAIIAVGLAGIAYIFSVGLRGIGGSRVKFQSRLLAKDLMEEILSKEHWKKDVECSAAPLPLRAEPRETRFGTTGETAYDDVDDYNGYIEAPPRSIDNAAMDGVDGRPNFRDFQRQVSVEYIDPETLGAANKVTAYKRINVIVNQSAQGNFQNPDFSYTLSRIVAQEN